MSDVLCYSVIPSFHAKKNEKIKETNPMSDVLYALVSIQLIGLLGFYNRKCPFILWTYKKHNFLYRSKIHK